jgi:hypothetical protein
MTNQTTKQVAGGFLGVLVLVVVALAAIGGTVYVANKSERQADGIKDEMKADVSAGAGVSLKDLLSRGESLRCEVEQGVGSATTTGVVFIADGKVRGDFSSEVRGTTDGQIASHILVDGPTVYVWSDMSAQGFKTSVNANAQASAQASAPSYDQKLDYRCDDWNADSSRFELPEGMTFMDINAAAAGAAAAGAGINGSMGGGDACSTCDMLPDGAAKTACQYRMGCAN